MSTSGERLYELVRTYAGLGWHRTGSGVDARTATWFADELSRRGLAVSVERVPFDRWTAETRLLVGGDDMDHLPLLTPWVGEVDSTSIDVRGFDPHSGGFPTLVDEPLLDAAATGATAAVLATAHPDGSLVGVNREPGATSTPALAAVLVAGRDLDACRRGPVQLAMAARIDPTGTTANVTGRREGSGRPVLLTTPLTGWFGCAGERGTGIAVLLELIDRLGDVPLQVVGTGGHELGFFGAHRYLAAHSVDARAVVHVGASIAVEEDAADGGRRLASTRVAMTTLDAAAAEPVTEALLAARLSLTASAPTWIGEADAWQHLGVPMLSMSGAGIDFHTPHDTPERATSPHALTLAADAIATATDRFLTSLPAR